MSEKPVKSTKQQLIRKSLIAAGVRNLREFGYPSVNPTNILTDMVFKPFFVSMLKENFGKGYDGEINALLDELTQAQP